MSRCGARTPVTRPPVRPALELSSLRRAVGVGSLVYLALPIGLFLAGWLQPGWAMLVGTGLLAGIAIWARRLCAVDGIADQPRPVPALAGAALVVITVVALSGPGGFGDQTWDWAKHNAILKDLIEQRWPVAYSTGRSDVTLTYYVAYYLPAALVGKAAGWTAANVSLFAWSALGAVLAFLWLLVLSEAPVWRCLAIFVFFSGLDMVGAAVWSTRGTNAAWIDDFSVEWWVNRWTYPNNLTLLAFTPHQALGAWLLTGLALDGIQRYPGRAPHGLGGALSLLWSPFATLGLLGLAAFDWATAWRARGGVRGLMRDGAELVGLLTGLVLTAYLLSRYWPMSLPPQYYVRPEGIERAALVFLPVRLPVREFGADYVVFVALEFLVLAALLAVAYRRYPREWGLLGVLTATLLALPLFRYGYFNDLVMRASIPALFTLQVLTVRVAEVVPRRSVLASAITTILILGAVYPANMLRLRIQPTLQHRTLVRIPPEAEVADLFRQQLAMGGSFFYVAQYIGAADSPFFRLLARRPVPVSVPKGGPGRPMRERGEPWWAGAVLATIVLGALVIFAWQSLPYTGFWYDETMQFWMSRGVDGFTPPGTQGDGRLRSVIRDNARGNLDPGGFSLLLHVWMRGGADPAWLRSLPFGLFVGGLLAMAGLGWVWRRSLTFAVLGAAVPLGFPLLLYHVTEVRAYTMEFAGVALGCLLLHRLQMVSVPRLALLGVALAVFMSSRYSYTIFAAAVCLVLIPAMWSAGGRDGRARLLRILALGGPVAAGAAFVALSLWLQHGRMTFEGGRLIEYLTPSTAVGKSTRELVRAATANLVSPVAIPVTVAALVALVPVGWRARLPAVLRGIGASPESRIMYRLAPVVLALSAALWPWHPWDVSRKWSLFLHALAAVLVLRQVADIAAGLLPDPPRPGRLGAWARGACPAIAALAIVGLSVHAATQRRTHWNDLTPTLRHLETMALAPGSVAVTAHPYPTLRYLCEYGPFVGRLPYPAPFRHPYGPGPPIGPETRYIIAYAGPEVLARLYPGHGFRVEPSWPSHLYRVEPTPGP